MFTGRIFLREFMAFHECMPFGFDSCSPALRQTFRRSSDTMPRNGEPSMGAGTNPCVIAISPIKEVVPALGAGFGMIGDLIGTQACRLSNLLRDFVQRGGGVIVGNDKHDSARKHGKGRRRLDGKLVER